jgi:dTDP-4-dehydrorhamnose reductase
MEMGVALDRVVVTGASGLLGSSFLPLLAASEVHTIPHGRLSDHEALLAELRALRPTAIFNCAAHTNVEAAEQFPEVDYAANAVLPGVLAQACKAAGAVLVHFSSTGCYGAWKSGPYTEEDALQPTTVHHRSKRDGENAVTASGCRSVIFRLGWLYGGAPAAPKNFVWNRLVEAASTRSMTSDDSQRGCPTHVAEVAKNAMKAIGAGASGVFNLTAHGVASRFDYVSTIVKASALDCVVQPGPAFKRRAAVSQNEAATNARLASLGLDEMQDWRMPLEAYVHELIASPSWRNR